MAPAAGAGAAPAAAAEAPKEEKTEFDLKLTGFDAAAKIKVIKEVRVITSLGLKEAKELVKPFWLLLRFVSLNCMLYTDMQPLMSSCHSTCHL